LRWIVLEGFHGFYYFSHAPFLFAVPNTDALSQIQTILKNAGIPEKRFEKFKQQAELNMLFQWIAKTHEGLIHEDQIYIKASLSLQFTQR